jgi:hypothetical protein
MDIEPHSPRRAWSWKEGDGRLSVEIRGARVVWTHVRYDKQSDRFHTISDHQHADDFTVYGPFHAPPPDVLEHIRARLAASEAPASG